MFAAGFLQEQVDVESNTAGLGGLEGLFGKRKTNMLLALTRTCVHLYLPLRLLVLVIHTPMP